MIKFPDECHGTLLMNVNIGSSNGFVQSGNQPLPELTLIQIYVGTWRHFATVNWFVIFSQVQPD